MDAHRLARAGPTDSVNWGQVFSRLQDWREQRTTFRTSTPQRVRYARASKSLLFSQCAGIPRGLLLHTVQRAQRVKSMLRVCAWCNDTCNGKI